jgi:hypothetical protein
VWTVNGEDSFEYLDYSRLVAEIKNQFEAFAEYATNRHREFCAPSSSVSHGGVSHAETVLPWW